MFLSLSALMYARIVPPLQLPAVADASGYAALDADCRMVMSVSPDVVRQMLAAHRVTLAALTLPVRLGGRDSDYAQDLERLAAAATFAAGVGCPIMTAVLPACTDTDVAAYRRVILERLRAVAAVLDSSRLRLAVEWLGPLHLRRRRAFEFIWRMEQAWELAKESGENVGLVLDTWHWHHGGGTLDDIRSAASRILYVHVSDAPALPPELIEDDQRLLPGDGCIDLAGLFETLWRIGYDGAVAPEVFGTSVDAMTAGDRARIAHRKTTALTRRCEGRSVR